MQDNFSPQQSLQLIQSMIEKTRMDMSENRFYFLMWGWLIFISIILQFMLKVVLDFQHHYIVWLVTFPAIAFTIMHSKKQTNRSARTYIGESMGYLWMGIGIAFFVMVFIISAGIGWLNAWPFMIVMYGLGTFISGKLLQFQPLVIGGIINWLLACVCVFFDYDYQILFGAAAILTSYIIPGHMIPKKNNL
jgi:hypothetical protein